MSKLEDDYKEVREQIISKVEEAVKLIREANKLVKKANVLGEFDEDHFDDVNYIDNAHKVAETLYDLSVAEYCDLDEVSDSEMKEYVKLGEAMGKLYGAMDDAGWQMSSIGC